MANNHEKKVKQLLSRRIEIDYAKGFAIFLLILSHCMTGENQLQTWIFSFHMPIFFIICGILQAEKYPGGIEISFIINYIKKRFFQLVIPYLLWGTVLSIFYQLLHVIAREAITFKSQMLRLITLQGIDSLWFIPVYLIAEFMFIVIILKLPYALRIGLFIGSIWLLYYSQMAEFSENTLYRLIVKIIIALIYMYIGYLVEYFKVINKLSVALAGCLVIVFGISAKWNGFVSIGSLELKNIVLFFLNGTVTSISIISIFKWIANKLQNPIRILDYYGRNTIVILCTNNLLIEISRILDYKLTGGILLKLGGLGTALFAIIISCMEFLIIKFMDKRGAVLFGRF